SARGQSKLSRPQLADHSMDNRNDRTAARLAWTRAALGNSQLILAPASSDASFRSYWRATQAGSSWIVMDSPPEREDPRPWLAIGERLAAAGLHVPKVAAQDLQQGFLLIEDLGSRLYLAELNKENADQLYGDAMDALLAMQTKVASRNLLVVEANNPGVIDFQGALHGPVTYDLASLLRDAYVAWPRERVEAWVESYRLSRRHGGVIGLENDSTRC